MLWLFSLAQAGFLVDASTAAALVEQGATVLDTRGWTDYLAGHIPGAVQVSWRVGTIGGPLSGLLGPPEVVAAEFAALGVDGARPVLVVGDWTAGWGEEGRILWDLVYLGHPAAFVLVGGMAAWTGEQAHWPSSPSPGHFVAQPREELRADRAEVEAALQAGALVVDVREPEEFAGAWRYGVAGQIPSARSAPWRALLTGGQVLPQGQPLIVYCTGGVRSAMAWAWLSDQGYAVANYDGSLWDWQRARPD